MIRDTWKKKKKKPHGREFILKLQYLHSMEFPVIAILLFRSERETRSVFVSE